MDLDTAMFPISLLPPVDSRHRSTCIWLIVYPGLSHVQGLVTTILSHFLGKLRTDNSNLCKCTLWHPLWYTCCSFVLFCIFGFSRDFTYEAQKKTKKNQPKAMENSINLWQSRMARIFRLVLQLPWQLPDPLIGCIDGTLFYPADHSTYF